jgi:uncharacterized membrane protein YbhN (UPF0104 family)
MNRPRMLDALKVLISAGLITYLLVFQVELREVVRVLSGANWKLLAIAAALIIGGTALRAVRWQILLPAMDARVPLRLLVQLYFIGAFFNIFLPTGLGGDAVRIARLARVTGRTPESIGVTLVDRATGLWVLFLLALGALPFSHHLLPPGWTTVIALGAAGGVLGGCLVMGTPLVPWLGSRIRLPGQQKLERLYRTVALVGYRRLGKACLVSLVFAGLLIALTVLVARALGVHLPVRAFIIFTPIISFSLALPISIGGLGVREQTFVLLFTSMGVSAAKATAISLMFYALTTLLLGLIGGVMSALEGSRGLMRHDRVLG